MKVSQLVVLLSLVFSMTACVPTECPPHEDLVKCTCKPVAYGLHVVCAEFNISSILLDDFSILRNYAVQTVLLYKLYFTESLPTDFFKGMKIKEINIEKCQLKFQQPAFAGLDHSLYKLSVAEHTLIKSQDKDQFSGKFSLAKLTNLNELSVKRNELVRIHDGWLGDNIPNVQTVMLDENSISTIDSHAFSSLTNLKVLSLSNNNIQSMQRSMVRKPATYLTRIDLSFNKLKTLPKDFFFAMPNLKTVVLSKNDLTVLDEKTWEPIWEQLDLLILLENKIDCGSSFQWTKSRLQPKELQGSCESPPELKGKPLSQVFRS